jgi:hypothetical protein
MVLGSHAWLPFCRLMALRPPSVATFTWLRICRSVALATLFGDAMSEVLGAGEGVTVVHDAQFWWKRGP